MTTKTADTATSTKTATVALEGRELVIRLPLLDVPESTARGKTLILARTPPGQGTGVDVDGLPIRVSVSATARVPLHLRRGSVPPHAAPGGAA